MNKQTGSFGFALPTVMIASVVMMIVLLSGLASTSSINASIRNQYYDKLATEAAQSGISYALNCIRTDFDVNWTTLKSNAACNGTDLVACTTPPLDARCSVVDNSQLRSYFSVNAPVRSGQNVSFESTGTVQMKRASGTAGQTMTKTKRFSLTQLKDDEACIRDGWSDNDKNKTVFINTAQRSC